MSNATDFFKRRDEEIFYDFERGLRQKVIAKFYGLSESRVKQIVGKERKKCKATQIK